MTASPPVLSSKGVAPDVIVVREGAIFLFDLRSPAAKEWVDEHVSEEDTMWWAGKLVVDGERYARPLAQGMLDDGLVLE